MGVGAGISGELLVLRLAGFPPPDTAMHSWPYLLTLPPPALPLRATPSPSSRLRPHLRHRLPHAHVPLIRQHWRRPVKYGVQRHKQQQPQQQQQVVAAHGRGPCG